MALENEGFKVQTYIDAESALAGISRNPPDLAVNVQGIYYHYEFGVEVKGRDVIARQQVAGQGTKLIFIDEDDILTDAEYYCREALRYRDHSRLGGG